jgi:hypothetical protein
MDWWPQRLIKAELLQIKIVLLTMSDREKDFGLG